MSWNWGVFLKSWLFGFLGFLIGIVSTVIYLALDVDLSQFDGTLIATIILAFATVTLVIVSHKYAKSTEEILKEQRKSRQISCIEKQLEKLYYPLVDILNNPHVMNLTGGENYDCIELKKIDELIPFQHLASDKCKAKIKSFIKSAFKERIVVMGDMDDVIGFEIVEDNFKANINNEIDMLNKKLQQIKNS